MKLTRYYSTSESDAALLIGRRSAWDTPSYICIRRACINQHRYLRLMLVSEESRKCRRWNAYCLTIHWNISCIANVPVRCFHS